MEDIRYFKFPTIATMPRLHQARKTHPMPMQTFRIRYILRLKVQESADPMAKASRHRFMELLKKVQEVD